METDSELWDTAGLGVNKAEPRGAKVISCNLTGQLYTAVQLSLGFCNLPNAADVRFNNSLGHDGYASITDESEFRLAPGYQLRQWCHCYTAQDGSNKRKWIRSLWDHGQLDSEQPGFQLMTTMYIVIRELASQVTLVGIQSTWCTGMDRSKVCDSEIIASCIRHISISIFPLGFYERTKSTACKM